MNATPETRAPSALFERDVQLAQFNSLFDAARRGEGRVVVVEGSPGIGKTRLLTAAGAAANAGGFTVLRARAGELESAFSFGVVRQLFEAPLAALTAEDRELWWNGAAALARPLFAAPGSSVDPESSFAMLHGLYWLAANVSLANPAVLLIDDLHWADAPSLRWLAYLARRLEGLPMLVAVATRAPEDAVYRDLVEAVLGDPASVAVFLDVLSEAAAAAFAEQRLGRAPDPAFAAALHHGSGGNPLYLAALLGAVERLRIEPTAEHVPQVLKLGPEAVSREVAARLARLPHDASEILRGGGDSRRWEWSLRRRRADVDRCAQRFGRSEPTGRGSSAELGGPGRVPASGRADRGARAYEN